VLQKLTLQGLLHTLAETFLWFFFRMAQHLASFTPLPTSVGWRLAAAQRLQQLETAIVPDLASRPHRPPAALLATVTACTTARHCCSDTGPRCP
jgi:hypothetical protein